MANLSISNIRERIFNTSKHEASVARPANSVSNPFAANTFKGNVLTADVFETSKPKEPAFTGATKLKASALVGSLTNLGSKIQAGIESIAIGQTEAARSLGMSQKQTYQYVVIPQAIKNIWPALGNEFITLIKESSIVSVIGVGDIF